MTVEIKYKSGNESINVKKSFVSDISKKFDYSTKTKIELFKNVDSTELFETNKNMFEYMMKTIKTYNNKGLPPKFEQAIEKHIRAYLLHKEIELDSNLKIISITDNSIVIDKNNLKKYQWTEVDVSEENITISFWKESNITKKASYFSDNHSWYENFKWINEGSDFEFRVGNSNFTIKSLNWIINILNPKREKIKHFTQRISQNKGYKVFYCEEIWNIYFSEFKWWRAILENKQNEVIDLLSWEKINLKWLLSSLTPEDIFENVDKFNFLISIYNLDFFKWDNLKTFKLKLKNFFETKWITLENDFVLTASLYRWLEYFNIQAKYISNPKDLIAHLEFSLGKINIIKSPKTLSEVKEKLFTWKFETHFTEQENAAIETLLDNWIIIDYSIRAMKNHNRLKNTTKDILEAITKWKIKRTSDFLK